jgi:peptide/nickel transport system substrate-binding protein
MRSLHRLTRPTIVSLALALAIGACAAPPAPPTTVHWLAMRPEPAADLTAVPDDLRWALERLVARGLVDEDSSGRVVPMLARSIDTSEDGRTYTFAMRRGLRFADGAPLTSADVEAALLAGLARTDHATYRWLLQSIRGVTSIRAGRKLPALGIETPDDSTLLLHLDRPDSLLLRKLALPGVATPVRVRDNVEGWVAHTGVGPYEVVAERAGKSLTLARRRDTPFAIEGPDSIFVRFAVAGRARALVRTARMDVVWPVPLGDPIRDDPLPEYRWVRVAAGRLRPARRLLLVLRADVPPTSALAARRALAHAVNRPELRRVLGDAVEPFESWWPGTPDFDFPSLDAEQTLAWLRRGHLGRSFHTTMVFDPDEVHDGAARRLQSSWARADLSVDLRPLRGARLTTERLSGRAQLLLVADHALLDNPVADLAALTRPDRDSPVGRLRTGWRTNDFRSWTWGSRPAGTLDRAAAQAAIEQESIVLPLGRIGWSWLQREGVPSVSFHPRFGLDLAGRVTLSPGSS